MRTASPRRRTLIPGTLALLCCCFLPAFAIRDTQVAERSPSGEREAMEGILDTLLRADPASRREAASGAIRRISREFPGEAPHVS